MKFIIKEEVKIVDLSPVFENGKMWFEYRYEDGSKIRNFKTANIRECLRLNRGFLK